MLPPAEPLLKQRPKSRAMALEMPQNPSTAAASMMRKMTNKTKAVRRYSGSGIIVAIRRTRPVSVEPLQVSHQARPSFAVTGGARRANCWQLSGCCRQPARPSANVMRPERRRCGRLLTRRGRP
jgi:hypothetical protein